MTFLLWTVRALATIAAGSLLALALRRRSAAARCVVLRATLVAAWLLPVAALFAPKVEVSLPKLSAPPPMSAPAPMDETAPTSVPKVTAEPVASPTFGKSVVERPVPAPPDPVPYATGFYALGTLLIVSRWLVGLARLRRIARVAVPVEGGALRVDGLGVPATFGLLQPRILLPRQSEEWPEARIRAAILHEEAHIRRRDWAWQTLAGLFAALHWANPAAWLLLRALRDTAESAADDEVLAAGLAPSAYARELLEVAKVAAHAGPAVAMARRGGVKDRVAAILSPNRDRTRPGLRLILGSCLGTLLTGAALATLAIAKAKSPASETTDPNLVFPSRTAIDGRIHLVDGRTATLVAIDRYQDGRRTSWTLDGRPTKPKRGDDRRWNRWGNQLGFRIRLDGPPVPDAIYDLQPSYPTGIMVHEVEDRLPRQETLRSAFDLPKGKGRVDLLVGFSSGPWRVANRSVPFVAKPDALRKGTQIEMALPKGARYKVCQLVGHDRYGKAILYSPVGERIERGKPLLIAWGTNVEPKSVVRVELQVRKTDWVRFPDLPVRPGPWLGPTPRIVAAPANPGPFTLRGGRRVAVMAVHDNVDGQLRSWAPSGTGAARNIPDDGWRSPLGDKPVSGWRRVEFLIRTTGRTSSDTMGMLETAPGLRQVSGGSSSVAREDGTFEDVDRFVCEVPRRAARTDLVVRYVSGAWTRDPRPVKPLVVERLPFVDTINGKPAPEVRVVAPYPMDLLGRNVRLVAFDRRGRRLGPHRWGAEPAMINGVRAKTTDYTFHLSDPKEIVRVAFEWRRWERVRFTGVRLLPGNPASP